MKISVIPMVVGALETIPIGLVRGVEELKISRASRDHPNYKNFEVSQNTGKGPGDLWRSAINQTKVKEYRLMLMWKTGKD